MERTIRPSGPGVDSATRQVFSPADSSELDNLIEEDRGRVAWKQDFEYCYGVHWPVRHITAFMATDEVAGSVSHRSTVREGTKTHAQHFSDSFTGRHLLLEKCGDISEFPARQALVDRLNKGWRKDLGGHSFNAAQSNIYSGPLQADDAVPRSTTSAFTRMAGARSEALPSSAAGTPTCRIRMCLLHS